MKRALFPGTFDPFTLGHLDITERSIKLFDEVVIGIGVNSTKKHLFSLEQRIQFIEETFRGNPRVIIKSFEGLTMDFCKEINAQFIVRGIRNHGDFEFEKAIARTNRKLSKIETIFILTSAENSFISSSIVRELIHNNGDYKQLVPSSVKI